MTDYSSADDVLEFAITREQEAVDFYAGLADDTKFSGIKHLLLELADEEREHKKKLTEIRQGESDRLADVDEEVADLKIADYLVDIEPSSDMDYQEVVIIAMKKEKAAFRLYTELARRASDPQLGELFTRLAQEEAKHKLHFEVEYDEHILLDN